MLLSLPNASDQEQQYFEDATDPFSSSVRGLKVRQPIIIFINRFSTANELIGFGSVVGWLATISHYRLWTFCLSLSSSPLSVSTVSLIFQSYNSDASSFVILYFPSSSSLFLDLLLPSFFSLRRPVVQPRGWMLKVTLEHIITNERPKKKNQKEFKKNLTPPPIRHPSLSCSLPSFMGLINPIFFTKKCVCPRLTPSLTTVDFFFSWSLNSCSS